MPPPKKTTARKPGVSKQPVRAKTATRTRKKASAKEYIVPDFSIVGIGASAGGLEAFGQFFKHMPADSGMAFIIIQHLDPTHKSILTDLVNRATPMQVFEVKDGMTVEPNCAYVIPPNRDLAILHGTLQVIEPTAPRGLRLPIDFFFRTFAQDLGERAICIVLSGTGTDGTLGLKAVKEKGGMVMVQDPKSAKYDGMPRSAIATGLADFVLPPDRMAERLLTFVKHAFAPGFKQVPARIPESVEDLSKIFVVLRDQTGHDFSYYKPNTILRRIERRMTVNQINRLTDYVRYLQTSPLEVETLFKEFLIGVSNFFRDPEAFSVVKARVIPALFEDRPLDDAVRVWVPGCATGEEAYSIAMLLREQMESLKQEYRLQVFATDIDSNAIETARRGAYPDSIAVDVPEEYLRRFFTKQDNNTYEVTKAVRDTLVFAEQNLIKDPPFSHLDLISCRNLLIYVESELQKRLLPLFHYALRKDGYLFLGNSETIGDATDLFKIVDRKWKVFQRTGAVVPHGGGIELTPAPFPVDIAGADAAKGLEIKPARAPSSREITERMLLEDYGPACVLVSEKGEGLYFHGATGKYLQPPSGEASWNIVGMAREGLRLDLSTALRKVATHKKPIRFEKVQVKTNGGTQVFDLTVKPGPAQPDQGVTLMVVFEDVAPSSAGEDTAVSEPSAAGDRRVEELERELRSMREYLQTTIEELETSNEELTSTNEELQSANEELQSTNEELETSKEELQSLNEELVTVNAEHEVRLDELSIANNDMVNLLASTEVGTIFLDTRLHVQRFTPAATRVVKLIKTDIGRPLSDIATKLNDVSLVEHVQELLDTLEPKETDVQTQDGRWYSMRVHPYRTTENVIDGAVITFIDISEQKQVQDRLRALSRAVEQTPNSVVITDAGGNIEYVNSYFTRQSGYTAAEALGKRPNLIKSEKTTAATFKEMWHTLKSGNVWTGELENRRKDGSLYRDSVSIYPVKDTEGNVTHFVGIQTEMKGRKQTGADKRQDTE